MLHVYFQDHRTSGAGEEDFKGFHHIRAWRPSWSCHPGHVTRAIYIYKLSFTLPKEAPRDILL